MIISVTNKKGGVGKSTTVHGLASILAKYGLKILVCDLDPQENITSIFKKDDSITRSILDLFMLDEKMSFVTYDYIINCIQKTNYKNIDLIAGHEYLDEMADEILIQYAYQDEHEEIQIDPKAYTLLINSFHLIENDYDFIILDNTPYFNIISKNALTASNGVLIPVETDGFSYDGLAKLIHKIYDIKGLNNNLDILGVFFNKVNDRTILFRELKEKFKEDLGDTLLNTYIKMDNIIKESNTAMIPLQNYSPKGKGTLCFMKLVEELHLLNEMKAKKLSTDINELELYLKK